MKHVKVGQIYRLEANAYKGLIMKGNTPFLLIVGVSSEGYEVHDHLHIILDENRALYKILDSLMVDEPIIVHANFHQVNRHDNLKVNQVYRVVQNDIDFDLTQSNTQNLAPLESFSEYVSGKILFISKQKNGSLRFARCALHTMLQGTRCIDIFVKEEDEKVFRKFLHRHVTFHAKSMLDKKNVELYPLVEAHNIELLPSKKAFI